MKIEEIRELINLIDNSSIAEFIYEANGAKLILKKSDYDQAKETEQAERINLRRQNITDSRAQEETNDEKDIRSESTKKLVANEEIQSQNLLEICSPMVGTFYQASAPGAAPYVKVGSQVSEGTIVCIVEAMKLFNEIEAEVTGEIVEILVSDGQLVEYGQPLFLVKP